MFSTVPRLATLKVPTQYETSVAWNVGVVAALSPFDPTISAASPRCNHASAISQHYLYIHGGQNDTHVLHESWRFNLLTGQFAFLRDFAFAGSIKTVIVPFENSGGPGLLFLGGGGSPGDGNANVSLVQVPLAVRVLKLTEDPNQYAVVDYGDGLLVELSGHFAAMLPNSSMIVVFGGSLRNNDLSDTTNNSANYLLSNRIVAMDLSAPNTYLLKSVLPIGTQPAER